MFWELNKLLSLPKYENVEHIFVGAFLTHQCAMRMCCQTQNLRGFLRTEGEFPNAILNGNALKLPVAPQPLSRGVTGN